MFTFDVALVPTPKYVPTSWETADFGEFVQYDPKFFEVFQIPQKQRFGLRCIRPKGKIPQPVGLTDYGYMFAGLKFSSIDMTGWDFFKVVAMNSFYEDCRRMSKIRCGILDFRACSNFNRMFFNCDGLTYLNIENWRMDSASTINEMFSECSSLETAVVARWNTLRLDTAIRAFKNCVNLRSIDCSGWTTPNLNIASGMFKGCKRLETANVDFNNVKGLMDMDCIFEGCSSLKKVILPDLEESPGCTLYNSFVGTPRSVWPIEYVEFMRKRQADEKIRGNGDWG